MQDQLRQAASLIKSGDKAQARQIISTILKAEPNNADAWYLNAVLVEGRDSKIQALERALAINPAHEAARKALNQLRPRDNDLFPLEHDAREYGGFGNPFPVQPGSRPITPSVFASESSGSHIMKIISKIIAFLIGFGFTLTSLAIFLATLHSLLQALSAPSLLNYSASAIQATQVYAMGTYYALLSLLGLFGTGMFGYGAIKCFETLDTR